jgi:hypothetical protein
MNIKPSRNTSSRRTTGRHIIDLTSSGQSDTLLIPTDTSLETHHSEEEDNYNLLSVNSSQTRIYKRSSTTYILSINHLNKPYKPTAPSVIIVPIVISKNGTFNVKTLAEIAQLVSFKEKQPNALAYKQLPRSAQKISMALHVHAQEWLSHISKISRKFLTTRTNSNPKPTHT